MKKLEPNFASAVAGLPAELIVDDPLHCFAGFRYYSAAAAAAEIDLLHYHYYSAGCLASCNDQRCPFAGLHSAVRYFQSTMLL